MKKRIISFLFFICLSMSLSAQSYVNNVIGRYLCTRLVLNNNGTLAAPPCTCHMELWPNNITAGCVEYQDSCFGGGVWSHITLDVEVLVDSTFQGRMPSTPTNAASGKLYSNDSIFYRIFYPSPPAYNYWKEFRGFKMYSFVGIEDLGKPENELLLSPQPATDILYLQSTQLSFKQKDSPLIYDVSGKAVSLPVQFINANTYKLDVSELSAGMYILAIKTDKGVVRKKIVVEH